MYADTPQTAPADAVCHRRACQSPGATWWNPHTREYYCPPCAGMINRALAAEGMRLCENVPRATVKACGNSDCGASTGICGRPTFGRGELDGHGYWDEPCGPCARAYEARWGEECWPSSEETAAYEAARQEAQQAQEQEWMQVTREMALDAGDPSLEGQQILW